MKSFAITTIAGLAAVASAVPYRQREEFAQGSETGVLDGVNESGRIGLVNVGDVLSSDSSSQFVERDVYYQGPRKVHSQGAGTSIINGLNKDGKIGLVNVDDILSSEDTSSGLLKARDVYYQGPRKVHSQGAGTSIINDLNKDGKIGLVNVDDILSSEDTSSGLLKARDVYYQGPRKAHAQGAGTSVLNGINKDGKIGLVNVDDLLSSEDTSSGLLGKRGVRSQGAGTSILNGVNKDGKVGLVNLDDILSSEDTSSGLVTRRVHAQGASTGVLNDVNKDGRIGLVNVDDVLSSEDTSSGLLNAREVYHEAGRHAQAQGAITSILNDVNGGGEIGLVNVGDVLSSHDTSYDTLDKRGVQSQGSNTGVLNGLNGDGRIGIIANAGDVGSSSTVNYDDHHDHIVVDDDYNHGGPYFDEKSDWYTYTYKAENGEVQVHVAMKKGYECDERVALTGGEDSIKEIVKQVAQRCYAKYQ
ncbi:hypothetical protein E4U43_008076 [Claviceps pusilla]|uniref:Uncharacterized protein n=1 Tax=Claviceps pusilla TaxID=123648 RepID=A0A9P7T112_9HYPO|nr:hypothetical protein E4U43_008076 [Claviceps pusilla]